MSTSAADPAVTIPAATPDDDWAASNISTRPTSKPPSLPAPATSAESDSQSVEVSVEEADDIDALDITDSMRPSALPQSEEDEAVKIFSAEYGVTLPDTSKDPDLIRNIAAILFKREWIEDERTMRQTICRILNALDPASYPIDGEWHEGPYRTVKNVFLAELSRHPKLVNVVSVLRKDSKKPPSLPK